MRPFSIVQNIALLAIVAPTMIWPVAVNASSLEHTAERILKDSFGGGGGGAVAIISKGGEVEFLDAVDLARAEPLAHLEPDTPMPIGSITKQVTAATVMLLVEDGLLDIDIPISSYLSNFTGPAGETTLRQLLSHRAGVVNFPQDFFTNEGNLRRRWTTEELLEVFAEQPLMFEPDTDTAYSNPGYILVGAVIEAVTGQEWHDVIEARIAAPLGLSQFAFRHEELSQLGLSGFDGSGENARAFAPQSLHWAHAAGGLVATASDLSAFTYALHEGTLLESASYNTLFVGDDASEEPIFASSTVRGREVISHSGGLLGYASGGFYDPQTKTYAAILTNAPKEAKRLAVARTLLAEGLGDPYRNFDRVEVPVSQIEPLLGLYESSGDRSRRLTIKRLGGDLALIPDGGAGIKLLPAGKGIFFAAGSSQTWLRFSEKGSKAFIELYPLGERETLKYMRVADVPEIATTFVSLENLENYSGQYRGPGDMIITITHDDKRPLISINGKQAVPMLLGEDDIFRIEGEAAEFAFKGGQTQPAEALVITVTTDTIEARRID